MGLTFAEKALARAAGLAASEAGQIVDARPDVVLSHDNTAAIAQIFKRLGAERAIIPEKLCITLDHAAPPPTAKHAQNHAETRAFVQAQGVRHFFEVGRGICHQVLSEEALVLPGQLILGADSHTSHFGWLGAFGAGVGRSEVAALWATGELWLRVPESLKIKVNGRWPRGVTAKDFCLHLIGTLGADGGLYASVEFSGTALSDLSVDSRMVIPNMMAEFGVKNAYLPPDDIVFDYLAERRARRALAESGRGGDLQAETRDWKLEIERGAIYPDPDAHYSAEYAFDAGSLEPLIARPHTVDNVVPLSQVAGTRINMALIGTCTNGRLEDIAAAASIVKGKRIAQGARLLIVPASSQVYLDALRAGYVETIVEAGGTFGTPGCGPCMGNHMGVPAPGEVVISSANRNFKGRMGQPNAEIYLGSPAVVAASAITGVITDPRLLD